MRNFFLTLAWFAVLSTGKALPQAAAPEGPASGKVLVLDNEHTLEGDIERVGGQYRVRRTVGETWVPGERVLQLCPDVKAAYTFLRNRANLNDADERLRLANWCRQNGLREQALAEVQEAVQLRPNDAASRRLLAHLRLMPLKIEAAAKPAAPEPEMPVTPIDLTDDSIGLFATKVQPILMNTCAGCHASDRGGKFKLTRCYESEMGNRRVMQQNLAAVLAQVNLREPRVSPLLTKAISVHGPLAQSPLKNRQAPAYRALEDWVRLTLANNPTLREQTAGTTAEAHAPVPAKTEPGKPEETFAGDAPPSAEAPAAPMTPPAPAAVAPAKTGTPDPFDPSVFNRQAHPEKMPTEPKKQ
jgi:hypothetical protein